MDDPEPFVSFVVDQVRVAAESVISALAAMKAEKPKFHEDDLTGLMRVPLAAGVRFLRWTVAEQPPGGYSPRGNPRPKRQRATHPPDFYSGATKRFDHFSEGLLLRRAQVNLLDSVMATKRPLSGQSRK
jgi:hypothetical protein